MADQENPEPPSAVLNIEDFCMAAEEIRALRRRVRELEDWRQDHDKWGHGEALRLAGLAEEALVRIAALERKVR